MKTGIVVEGGGMKGMYSAGVLDAMLLDRLKFDYGIGVSAGAGNLITFIAGQFKRNYRFYAEHIMDNNYSGIKSYLNTGNYMGVKYIYGTLTNEGGKDPLNYDCAMSNPMEFVAAATDVKSGKTRYFSKNDLKRNDYRVLMASSSMPILSKPVEIDNGLYCDGGVSDSIPVQKALDDGCDRLVINLMRPKGFVKQPERHRRFYTHRLKNYPELIKQLDERHNHYMEELKLCEKLEMEGRAVIIRPEEPLQIGTVTKNPEKIVPVYHTGIADYSKLRNCIYNLMEK